MREPLGKRAICELLGTKEEEGVRVEDTGKEEI